MSLESLRPTSRRLALAAALLLALPVAQRSQAHDWPSPSTRVAARTAYADTQTGPMWAQTVWAGPQAGPPAAPDAPDCHRAPRLLDLRGPSSPPRSQYERRREFGRAEEPGFGAYAKRSAPAVAPSEGAAESEALADRAKSSAPTDRAESGVSARADSAAPATAPQGAATQRSPFAPRYPRPATEPVTAGVVDDNADFGAYLDYRSRNAHLPVRARDVSERYLLTVHDAAGRPVPDAEVSLYAGGRELPLWARTDAGGQVWLHPRVMDGLGPQPDDGGPGIIEVQAGKDGARGSALLRRGQRDALQVRLDATLPPQRARLDLVFLVDATGSMGDEIDKLKRSMRSMADQIARLPSRPDMCFAVVAYRDRGDAFFVRAHDFSDDLGAVQRNLAALEAGGGGDYPEALDEALHATVHRLSWRGDGATRLVVLVADAPPHLDYGAPWYDDDMQGALARGIKLMAVGASGLDPVGQYVLRQVAQYTGGRFVFLTYADARDPSSGPGRETTHDVQNYSVESLDKLVVRLVSEELARRPRG